MKTRFAPTEGRAVQLDEIDWVPFPDALSAGGIRWKLLNVAPELGSWAAIFDCPAGSSFNSHHHIGPGEYFLTKGRMAESGTYCVPGPSSGSGQSGPSSRLERPLRRIGSSS